MIGLVIIILILIVGGIYIWQSRTQSGAPEEGLPAETLPAAEADLDALEQELDAADLDIEASVIDSVE